MKNIIAIATITLLLLQTLYPTLAWNLERPADHIRIGDRVENASTDGNAAVGLGIAIGYYNVPPNDYGSDFVQFNVSMTANSRIGITYDWYWDDLWWIPESELYYRSDMVGVGDDVIVSIDIPQPSDVGYFAFRFYGGWGSAEYQRLYVSSNGFISFDNRSQPSPTPSDIPSTSRPNALIAAVWSDLNVDSSSSIITGFWAIGSHWYYVIIWKNVLHKASGNRLTFEIILENAPQYYPANRRYGQSQVWISYKDVSSINTAFTYGIEDQQGAKGLGWLCSGSSLGSFEGYTIWFYQSSNSYFLKQLTLTFQDANPNTQIDIREEDNGDYLRGYNIRPNWDQPWEPDYTYRFLKAIAGTAALLIGAWSGAPAWVAAGGFIVETVLVSLDLAEILAYNQISGRSVDVFDKNDGSWQKANATALTYDYVVDASLSLVVHWILRTPNDVGTHSLTITAKLEYYEYTATGETIEKTITTSVVLEIGPDDNNDPGSADTISEGWYHMLYIGGYDENDYYKIYLEKDHSIYIYLEETSSDHASINIYLYDPNQVERVHKTLQPPPHYIYLQFITDSSGYWYIRVELLDDHCFYSLFTRTEPAMMAILNELGFTNVEESTAETFQAGVYKVTLYAEFAGYHPYNTLSWYPVGTENYNTIFLGYEGEEGYVDPPYTKYFTAHEEFGLSFKSPEARYFTETDRNPDGLKHAQVYKNLNNPDTYFIGFENKYGQAGDKDYNDMVIAIEYLGPANGDGGGGGGGGGGGAPGPFYPLSNTSPPFLKQQTKLKIPKT